MLYILIDKVVAYMFFKGAPEIGITGLGNFPRLRHVQRNECWYGQPSFLSRQ